MIVWHPFIQTASAQANKQTSNQTKDVTLSPYFSLGATDCGCNSNASHQHWPDALTALHGPGATDAIAVDVVVLAYDTVKVQFSLAEIAMASICTDVRNW